MDNTLVNSLRLGAETLRSRGVEIDSEWHRDNAEILDLFANVIESHTGVPIIVHADGTVADLDLN